MAYKTYGEVIAEHITFLHEQGLDVEKLVVDAGLIRCRAIGSVTSRGELTYKTTSTQMNNSLLGLATVCRGVNGWQNFQSYGLSRREGEQMQNVESPNTQAENSSTEKHELAARKACGFWRNSQLQGSSNYLYQKRVGAHGLRFRDSNEYGRVAVVPMFDGSGRLWNYQLLNPNGTKRHPKDARTDGLSYCLAPLTNGVIFGIAESYVTAATCYEISGVSTVCAFSCHNLASIAKILRLKYPSSPIIFFADNDRHLPINQGVSKAQEACDAIDGCNVLAIPDFFDCEPAKNATDWNDLVRLKGQEFAKDQMQEKIAQAIQFSQTPNCAGLKKPKTT